MRRQEAENGFASSEYLTVPELAKVVRRNRKTVYGWIATGEIGEADGFFIAEARRLCATIQPEHRTFLLTNRLVSE